MVDEPGHMVPAILQPLKGFIDKLGGPAAEELGLLFGDKVRMYRLKNSLRMLEKAKAMLDAAGVEPSAVPLRTLLPLLERGLARRQRTVVGQMGGLARDCSGFKPK